MSITRIPLTIVTALGDGASDNVLVAVLASDLDDLEARLDAAGFRCAHPDCDEARQHIHDDTFCIIEDGA